MTQQTPNPAIANIINQFKASNPSLVSNVSVGSNNWYAGVKSGAYRPAGAPSVASPGKLGDLQQTGADLVNDTNSRAATIVNDLSGKPSFSGAADVVGNVAGEAGDILGNLFKTAYQATTPPPIKAAINAFGSFLAKGAAAAQQAGAGNVLPKQSIGDLWSAFSTQHPDLAKSIAGVAGGAALVAGAGEGPTVSEATNAITTGAKTAGEMVADTIKGGTNTVSDIAQGTKNLIKGIPKAVGDLINGKSIDEILATPQNEVYKLSSAERSAYFDAQQEKITQARTAADTQVKADLATKAQASQQQADELNRQLQVASRDKVLELRPKIRSAMAEQSATYRNLVDEAIAPVKDTPVKAKELASFVDGKYPDNPGLASAIKERLGLNEKTMTPLIGESGKFEVPTGDTTLGKIYEQTKSLKQDISAGASKGTKVFTPDDKLTDDAISTLSDYMKSKGVDLSQANQFWAKYAPVRNQLVTEAKPFLQTPTQTKTFANTLLRVAKGTDVNNENFIAQVEDLLGEPITADNKAILAKLDTNAKEQLANEMDAEEKLANNKLLAEKQKGNLSAAQFQANQKAVARKIVKKLLLIAAGSTVGGKVGGLTGEVAGGIIGSAL